MADMMKENTANMTGRNGKMLMEGGTGGMLNVPGGMESGHRPAYIHGSSDMGPQIAMATNNGRVDVMVRGPGQMAVAGPGKGKAQIAHSNIVKLACSDPDNMGGYHK